MPDEAPLEWVADEEDDTFLMASLFPRTTGLPMAVWVNERGGARHDARLKVSTAGGGRMQTEGAAVVGIRPEPRLIHGSVSARDMQALSAWIRLNEAVLIDYWNSEADTADLIERLRPLPA